MAYIDRFNPPNMHHIGGINYVMMTDCANMVKEIERLREALRFYTDRANPYTEANRPTDDGMIARAALKEGE